MTAVQILGKIGQHREQHEAAHKGDRLIEAERIEARLHAAQLGHTAKAVDRVGANIFDATEQCLATVFANHVSEQLAEKTDVRILGNDRGRGRHELPVSIIIAACIAATEAHRVARCRRGSLPYASSPMPQLWAAPRPAAGPTSRSRPFPYTDCSAIGGTAACRRLTS